MTELEAASASFVVEDRPAIARRVCDVLAFATTGHRGRRRQAGLRRPPRRPTSWTSTMLPSAAATRSAASCARRAPILMLTARGAGRVGPPAPTTTVKPFSWPKLVARVRRAGGRAGSRRRRRHLRLSDCESTRLVPSRRAHRAVAPRGVCLRSPRGRACQPLHAAQEVWGLENASVETSTVDIHAEATRTRRAAPDQTVRGRAAGELTVAPRLISRCSRSVLAATARRGAPSAAVERAARHRPRQRLFDEMGARSPVPGPGRAPLRPVRLRWAPGAGRRSCARHFSRLPELRTPPSSSAGSDRPRSSVTRRSSAPDPRAAARRLGRGGGRTDRRAPRGSPGAHAHRAADAARAPPRWRAGRSARRRGRRRGGLGRRSRSASEGRRAPGLRREPGAAGAPPRFGGGRTRSPARPADSPAAARAAQKKAAPPRGHERLRPAQS
jgi:hypothetical protein